MDAKKIFFIAMSTLAVGGSVQDQAAAQLGAPAEQAAKIVFATPIKEMMTAKDIRLSNNRAKRNGDRAWQALNDYAACRFQAVNNSGGLGNPESVYPSDDPKINALCRSWADRNKDASVVRADKESKMPMTAQQANYHVGKLLLTRTDRALTAESLKTRPFNYQWTGQSVVRLVPGRSA